MKIAQATGRRTAPRLRCRGSACPGRRRTPGTDVRAVWMTSAPSGGGRVRRKLDEPSHATPSISAAASASAGQPSTMSVLAGVLRPVVADAADAGDEQHRGGQSLGEDLRVVAGAARHAHEQARRIALRRPLQRVLECRRPSASASSATGCVSVDPAGAFVGLGDQLFQRLLPAASTRGSASRNWNSISAPPGTMLGAPGSSRMRPVVHTLRGPATCGNRASIAAGQPHQRHAGILADRHARGAGVVLHALETDPVLPDADDAGDHAEAQAGRIELVALLDMRFQVAAVARRVESSRAAGPASPACAQRVAQCRAVVAVAVRVDLRLVDPAPRTNGCRGTCRSALLVRPGRRPRCRGRGRARPPGRRSRPSRHPASRRGAGSPDGCRAAVSGPSPRRAADDVADAVDLRRQPGLGQAGGEPVPRGHVVGE